METEKRYCQHCGKKMHKNNHIWHLHTCASCYNKLPEYRHLRAADQSKRFKRWYNKPGNKEKEINRARENYFRNKEREKEASE